ncbi:zincin-like metallopeptidase domain-containing protein, partial [Asticcacaulis sp. W401b]|uniref:zincin-like metallopeptidase domain-containing protein n=1 Tax=Asticcacaulis sp. W401b TaxID=3388666 RepID=UPI003970A089
LCRYRHNAHATGHSSRLDRFRPGTTTEDYAREELVAELTSHLVSLHLGLSPSETVFRNHVAYLASWAGILRDRPGELLKAAGKAQAACDFILSIQAEALSAELAVAA